MAGQWFSASTLVSSTNKINHHNIAEILLKGGPKGGVPIMLNIWQNHASRLDIWIFHVSRLSSWIDYRYCQEPLGVSYIHICGRPYCDICMCSFIVGFCCLVIWQFLIAARL